ncbi:hypothetical protein DE146DRAFT_293396 [Phaeosphaeria sp. MPI-PUGE-AT-0046c]|nr:hypothetical protein DE146DRAFT_293396 [Phaeosphaeria sp. MPI-PUGE-AT-0046c]
MQYLQEMLPATQPNGVLYVGQTPLPEATNLPDASPGGTFTACIIDTSSGESAVLPCKPQTGATREEALLKVVAILEKNMGDTIGHYTLAIQDKERDEGWFSESDAGEDHGSGRADSKSKRKSREQSGKGEPNQRTKLSNDKIKRPGGRPTGIARERKSIFKAEEHQDGEWISELDDETGNPDRESSSSALFATTADRKGQGQGRARIGHSHDKRQGAESDVDNGQGGRTELSKEKKKGGVISGRNREAKRRTTEGNQERKIDIINLLSDADDAEEVGGAEPLEAMTAGSNDESRRPCRRRSGNRVRDSITEASRN